jgi:hypothetical protein
LPDELSGVAAECPFRSAAARSSTGIFRVPVTGGTVTQIAVTPTLPPAIAVDGSSVYWITTDPRPVNAPGIPAPPSGTVMRVAK